jgi:hypothetical protein
MLGSMYITIRRVTGTTMACKECGHTISLNKICEQPLKSATDMLKHMAAHNAARAFAPIQRAIVPQLKPETPPASADIPVDSWKPPVAEPVNA